jgi:hypothetical protein
MERTSFKKTVTGSTSSCIIDSDNTAGVIFHVTAKLYDAGHTLVETDQYRYRVDTTGNISFVSLDTVSGDGADTTHFSAP